MKRKTKLAIAGVVVIVVGYALYKYLKPTEVAVEGEGETPSDEGTGGGFLSSLTDVFGLTSGDEADLTDTPTPDLTDGGDPSPGVVSTDGTGAPTSYPTGGACNSTSLDHLEPLPGNLGCTAGYDNVSQCSNEGSTCIPGFLGTPTNACGAGIARWQALLNKHYKSAGDGQCIPTGHFGRATPQTNQKTQELIASGAISAS